MKQNPPVIHPAVLVMWAAALVLMMAVLPYAGGYEAYRRTLVDILWGRWFDSHNTTWQYGVLVPVAVGWLVWQKREVLRQMPVRGSAAGLPVLMLALGSYFVGYKANNYYFGYLAVQSFMLGSVVWLLGWAWMRALTFPWLVLAMMWPLVFMEDRLGFPLRMLSTEGVMFMARLVHAPVVAQGTAIFSAGEGSEVGSWMTLKVDGPCSGMNTLFALMFVALLFSHHQQPTLLRRTALFLLSIPLAILGNMVRIALLISGCAVFGQDFAVGNDQMEMSGYHLLSGLAVFLVAFAGLQWASSQMNRRCLRKGGTQDKAAPAFASTPVHPTSP